MLRCLLLSPLSPCCSTLLFFFFFAVVVHGVVSSLLLSAHELEVVDLLELGDDELAPHVGDLHLQLVDLHVAQLHRVVHVVHLALGRNPPVVKSACSLESTICVSVKQPQCGMPGGCGLGALLDRENGSAQIECLFAY